MTTGKRVRPFRHLFPPAFFFLAAAHGVRTGSLALLFALPAHAETIAHVSGRIATETRLHAHGPSLPDQTHHAWAVTAELRIEVHGEGGVVFEVAPWVQHHSDYDDTLRWDLREAYLGLQDDAWRMRLGYTRVSWGAMDALRLIDIINQRDRIDLLDGAEKLGQPMLAFTLYPGLGTLELYAMPYFREMPFPDRRGRLRPPLPVDTDRPLYESGSSHETIDLAARFLHTVGTLDFGLHLFHGRNRTPLLVPDDRIPPILRDPGLSTDPMLVPLYEDIRQVGLEAQWALGGWLLKSEAFHRSGFLDRYAAFAGGVERTLYGWAGTRADLSLLAEYAYDERGKTPEAMTIFDNDLLLGFRLALGGVSDLTMEGGVLYDFDNGETIATLQAGRRIGSAGRIDADLWFLLNTPEDSVLYGFRREDHLRVQWSWSF